MIIVPNNKKLEIIVRIKVCLIWWTSFDSRENGGKKSFSYQTKASISHIPIKRTWLWCPITKKLKIITRIQVYLISWMNFDHKENGGKKSFSCKSKDHYHVSQWEKHNCNAHYKNNGDYYEYSSLSYFTDEL